MTNWIIKSTVSIAMTCAVSSIAFAQEGPTPSRSVESFGFWDVECNQITVASAANAETGKKESVKKKAASKSIKDTKSDEKSKAAKTKAIKQCVAFQAYRNNKSNNEIARIAFQYDGEGNSRKLLLYLRTLTNVNFENNPAVYIDGKKLGEGKFTQCAGGFCYGKFDIDAAGIKKILESKKPSWNYFVTKGRSFPINIGKKGLKDALASLKAK